MHPMDTTLGWGVAPLLLLSVTLLGTLRLVSAQEDDFSSPIKCYTCDGLAEESECSDPIDTQSTNTTYKECDKGVCLKLTKYEGYKLRMQRGCSADIDFKLTMIDGVCRTERNGNGYLCMCGKNLCNASPSGPSRLFLLGHGPSQPGLLLITAFITAAACVNSWSAAAVTAIPGFDAVFPIR